MIARVVLALSLGLVVPPLAGAPADAASALVSIDDVTVAEPNWPQTTTTAVFQVSLDQPTGEPVTMDYQVFSLNSRVVAETSGSVLLAPGETAAEIVLPVGRDSTTYKDVGFSVQIGNLVGADLAEPEGRWTGSEWIYDVARGHGNVVNSDRTGRFYCGALGARAGTGTGPATAKGGIFNECESDAEFSVKKYSYTSAPRVPTPLFIFIGELRTVINGVERVNPPADTRPYLGDGGDAYAHASDIRITAPGVDIRVENAWASAGIHCASLDGSLPPVSSDGMVTGVTVNGQPIQIGDKVNYRVGIDHQTGIIFNADYTSPKGERIRTAILVARSAHDPGDAAIARVDVAPGYPGTGYYSNPCTDVMKAGERYAPVG